MSRFKSLLICLVLVTFFTNSAFATIKCISCDASITGVCLSNPNLPNIGTCDSTTDTCYTYIKENILYRGCSKPELDCENAEICTTCTIDKCNVDIFPANRRKCFQCTGAGCATIDNTKTSELCPTYKADDQCYTFAESETSIKRGCVSDGFDKCTAETCCSTNDCNNVAAVQTVSCYKCDSTGNNACKRPATVPEKCTIDITEKCDEKVLLGNKAQCFTYFQNDSVKRGCRDTKPDVPAGDDLIVCNTPLCNSDCSTDTKCYVCDSSEKPECSAIDKLKDFELKCDAFVGSCYQCEDLDGKKVTRGCGANQDDKLVCSNCRGKELCNNQKLKRSCYVCDSTTDSKCATKPEKTQFCAEGDECMTSLSATGSTIRSCKKTTDECKEPTCKSCTTHNCNTHTLVDENLSCYTCKDAAECMKYQNATEKLTKCTNVVANDKCYMFSADGTTMSRGCISDSSAPAECKSSNEKCLQCYGDGCNSRASSSKTDLKCIQCDNEDEKCAWRYDRKSATECKAELEYYKSDSCYVLTTAEGNVTRGCTSESTVCTSAGDQCRRCYTAGCNTESRKDWSCIRCRSDNDGQAACKVDGKGISKTPCTNVPTFETRGCYTENWYGVIIRGCLTDLDPLDFTNCKNDKYKWCNSCDDIDCNTDKAPNSSTNLQCTFSTIALCIFVFIKFLF